MRMQWRWRCKDVLPMLDDEEFHAAMSKRVKGVPKGDPKAEFAPVLEEYQRITDSREANFLAIWHHNPAQNAESR